MLKTLVEKAVGSCSGVVHGSGRVCVQALVSSTVFLVAARAVNKGLVLSTAFTRVLPGFSRFQKAAFLSAKTRVLPIINRTYKNNNEIYISNSLLIRRV